MPSTMPDSSADLARNGVPGSQPESEGQFPEFFDQTPLGYQSLDAQGCLIEINQAWTDMLGYRREEVIGRYFADFLAPEYVQAFRERFPLFLAQGKIHSEFYMLHKDGSRRYVTCDGRIGFKPDGSCKQTHCLLKDETVLRRSEEAASRSRMLLDTTLRLAHVGGWEWDKDGQSMTWTNETYRIHGMEAGELPAGSLEHLARSLACHDPADRPLVEAAFRRCAEEGVAYSLELPLTRADHQRIWVRTTAEAVKLGDCVIKVIGTIADITEHKRSEAALQESERLFRSYFDLGLIGMAITSVDKGWRQVNDRLCSMLGYPRDELIARTWPELTHPDDLAADMAQFSRVLTGQSEGYSLDKRFIAKDGRTVFAAISVGCLRKPDGSVDHFVAMVQDITERKQAEVELKQQLAELQQWYEVMLDREVRVLELKREADALRQRLGEPPRYALELESDPLIDHPEAETQP